MVGSTVEEGSEEENSRLGWSLVKVFDVVALVLVAAVVVRAAGSVVAALGVPSANVNFGAVSGSGVSINQSDFPLPTFLRLEYGTEWADTVTGLLVLGGVALLVLPRMLWDLEPEDNGLSFAPQLLVGTGIVAALAAVASVVEIVNTIWHTPQVGVSSDAITVSASIAALALTATASILSWSSRSRLKIAE
jgi:hypothetical protein